MDNCPVSHPVPHPPTLLQQLDAGMAHLLTLLLGPAGCGKSALLHRWVVSRGWLAAWVTLQAGDNVPQRFLQHLVTASQTITPGITLGDGEVLRDGLIKWLNALAAVPYDFVIILDDYDVITAPLAHEFVTTILDYPPPRLHLFITARTEPPLPVPRLRVRRQLIELRLKNRDNLDAP